VRVTESVDPPQFPHSAGVDLAQRTKAVFVVAIVALAVFAVARLLLP